MPKTLLLCFIHGFKGDEETFFDFPANLKEKVCSQFSSLEVQTRVYPKYETRGDLAACVETFKEWLQEQVGTIETQNGNKNAISVPDVGVILVAHSMGGFVAADTLFSVLDNRPVSPSTSKKLMFPLIHGILLFDSPLNGLARPMFAYGAFAQYQNLSGILSILSSVSSSLPILASSISTAASTSTIAASAGGAMVASQAHSWRRWQALASRTGAYGAIMAGGVAAYMHREQIYNSLSNLSMPTRDSIKGLNYKENISQGLTYVSRDAIGEGFTWMASHLKFVGALMKTGQLTRRLERLQGIQGVGVVNLYTSLGENGVWNGGYFVPKRTFCAVLSGNGEKEKEMWREIPNTKAENEIFAHCSMFKRERNTGYDFMLEEAKGLVCAWVGNDTQEVKDEYMPSMEVLHRSMSEHKAWDDDGKVLETESPEQQVAEKRVTGEGSGQEESEDEKQLQAILKCADMPLPEGGDEAEVMDALDVPLPVDEDIDASSRVLELSEIGEKADEVPLPEDIDSAEKDLQGGEEESEDEKTQSSGWFKNPIPALYGNKKQEPKVEETQQEKTKGDEVQGGWFKNSVSIIYGGKAKYTASLEEIESVKKPETKEIATEEEHKVEESEEEQQTEHSTDNNMPGKKSEEKDQNSGWFKNPIPSFYGAKKDVSK